MKLKVAFLINSLAGGGAERILSTIIDQLCDRFDITLVLMEDIIEFNIPNNVEIVYLVNKPHSQNSLSKFLNIGFFSYKFAQVCKEREVDISFSLTTRPNLINSLSKLFYKKTKKVLYEVATPSVQYHDNSISSRIVKFLIKRFYSKADILLANSKGVTNDLKFNFVSNKEVITVYSPIDVTNVINSPEIEEFQFSGEIINFITVGRLDSGKNHEMMIRAFSKIKNTKTALYILGMGELQENLVHLVKESKLEERVFLLGFDSNPFKYLKQSDIFLFTSRYEGLPTVLIEALACRLPVISTDCLNGPREILSKKNDRLTNTIEYGEYGILTPVDNELLFTQAIDELLENKELYDRYKESSIERAKYFSMENSIKKLIDILEKA